MYFLESSIKAAKNLSKIPSIILVGNKVDLTKEMEVCADEARSFAAQYDMAYIEVSALTGYNIDKILTLLVQEMFKKPSHVEIAFNYAYSQELSSSDSDSSPIDRIERKIRSAEILREDSFLDYE